MSEQTAVQAELTKPPSLPPTAVGSPLQERRLVRRIVVGSQGQSLCLRTVRLYSDQTWELVAEHYWTTHGGIGSWKPIVGELCSCGKVKG